jgi:hypothetical protein
MSNISNQHPFQAYASSGKEKSVALSGQRLLVVRYRKTEGKAAVRNSVCASVPTLTRDEVIPHIDALMPHVISMIQSVQDSIGREGYEAGSTYVSTESISVSSCLAYLTQQAAGERLTADVIREWFSSELQDILMLAFAEKMGLSDAPTDEETHKLGQILNVYRDKFASMAGGRTMFDAGTRAKLSRALELIDCSEGIGAKLQAKLQAMNNVNVEEMLGL